MEKSDVFNHYIHPHNKMPHFGSFLSSLQQYRPYIALAPHRVGAVPLMYYLIGEM